MKTLIIAAIGFLLGVGAAGAGAFWALENGYIPGFGAPLVQPDWPDVSPGAGEKPEVPEDPKISEQVLPVPKAVAGEGFQKALQVTVATHNELAETGTLLVERLNEMNARSLSRNFDGFFDVVFDAKTLLAQQVAGTGELSLALASLEREIPTVTDPELAAAASAMVTKGKKLTAALGTYSASIEPVLSGKVPGQGDIDAVFQAASDLRATSEEFNSSAESAAVIIRAALDAAPILQVERVDATI
jgi:hypothetical protein